MGAGCTFTNSHIIRFNGASIIDVILFSYFTVFENSMQLAQGFLKQRVTWEMMEREKDHGWDHVD